MKDTRVVMGFSDPIGRILGCHRLFVSKWIGSEDAAGIAEEACSVRGDHTRAPLQTGHGAERPEVRWTPYRTIWTGGDRRGVPQADGQVVWILATRLRGGIEVQVLQQHRFPGCGSSASPQRTASC